VEGRRILVAFGAGADPRLLPLAADLIGPTGGGLTVLVVGDAALPEQDVAAFGTPARTGRGAAAATAGTATVDVCCVPATPSAVATAAGAVAADLLLLPVTADGVLESTLSPLLAEAPCDVVAVRVAGDGRETRSVLVPARAGAGGELALALGFTLAARRGAHLTLLHLDRPGRPLAERAARERRFRALLARAAYPRVRSSLLPAADATAALLAESRRHQVTVLAAARRRRAGTPGPQAEALLRYSAGTALVVVPRSSAPSGLPAAPPSVPADSA
jgi:hypothetical protein